MITVSNHVVSMPKPARARSSWPIPATHRPAMSEPSPGVASWFTTTAFRAPARLSGFRGRRGEDSLISIHQRANADWPADKQAHAAKTKPHRLDDPADHQQTQVCPKVFGHHLPARLHGPPEIQPLINNQRQGEHPTDPKVRE